MNAFSQLRRAALLIALPLGVFGCNDAAQNSVDNATNVVTPTAASTRTAPTPTVVPKKTAVTLFVPTGDGDLKKVALSTASLPPETNKAARQLVALLMEKSPKIFPKGTAILDLPKDFSTDDKVIAVNFNKALLQDGFWHGESKTGAAVYAVVNTISQYGKEEKSKKDAPLKVRFLVEGKPLQSLGEFDLSDPLEPDMSLVNP